MLSGVVQPVTVVELEVMLLPRRLLLLRLLTAFLLCVARIVLVFRTCLLHLLYYTQTTKTEEEEKEKQNYQHCMRVNDEGKIFWLKAFYRTYHPEATVKW